MFTVNYNTCSTVHFRSQVNLAFVNRLKNFREPLVIKFQLDLFAFDKERFHNEVEIDFFGLFIDTNFPLPKNYSVANDFIVSRGSRVSRFVSRVRVLACCGGILRVDKLYSVESYYISPRT